MRLLWVTDDRILEGSNGDCHTSFPHQFDYFAEQLPELTEFTVWGRRVRLPSHADARALYPCPSQIGGCAFRYVGPRRTVHRVTEWPMLLVRGFPALRREVRRADIVFLRIPANFPSLAYHALRRNQMVVTHVVGNPRETIPVLLPRLKWVAPLVESHTRKLTARADVASFVSTALRDEYGAGCRESLITNACTLRRAQIVPHRRVDVSDPPVVTYLGRLSREKGVLVLIDAFAILAQRTPARLDIVGTGPMEKEMEERAEHLGIAGRMTCHGRVPPGEPFFAAFARADVIVLPSFTEGLPSVIPEAMSQGVPVVASCVGGIPELLGGGNAGLLVPPGDPAALADALQRALTDRALRERLITAGLELAAEQCMENQAGRIVAGIAARLRNGARVSGRP